MLKSLLSNKEKLLELANTPLNENCSVVILKKLPEKLGDPGKFLISPFLRTARALIDVHREEMILRDGDERLILNMRHDTSSYSNKHKKESINMIYIYNVSNEDYLEDLFANEKITNHLSGNPTPISDPIVSSSPTLTSLEESDLIWEEFEAYLARVRRRTRSYYIPPGNDDLPFDIESDLREIEYLLNHDPTKEMDSILEMFTEMFTDEHTLDYSSPPLHDDVDDDLVELEFDNDDVYDDPFDSKEDKIRESKLLIDELDPPRSSDFLPSPECDSVLYEDFSKVDALPSTNNEDKVFNPGILIHENLFEVTIRATPDKNDCPDFEASRARGFVLRSLELHILSFIMGIQYPNLID
ncbi:hypothetical protein Tco_1432777 [Tanacetum coccineum]